MITFVTIGLKLTAYLLTGSVGLLSDALEPLEDSTSWQDTTLDRDKATAVDRVDDTTGQSTR